MNKRLLRQRRKASNQYEKTLNNAVATGLLPQVITDHITNAPIAVIICDTISGRRDYVGNMPRTLSLSHTLADGQVFRGRYAIVESSIENYRIKNETELVQVAVTPKKLETPQRVGFVRRVLRFVLAPFIPYFYR